MLPREGHRRRPSPGSAPATTNEGQASGLRDFRRSSIVAAPPGTKVSGTVYFEAPRGTIIATVHSCPRISMRFCWYSSGVINLLSSRRLSSTSRSSTACALTEGGRQRVRRRLGSGFRAKWGWQQQRRATAQDAEKRRPLRNGRIYCCCRELAVARALAPQAKKQGNPPKVGGRTVSRPLLDRSCHDTETDRSYMGL